MMCCCEGCTNFVSDLYSPNLANSLISNVFSLRARPYVSRDLRIRPKCTDDLAHARGGGAGRAFSGTCAQSLYNACW